MSIPHPSTAGTLDSVILSSKQQIFLFANYVYSLIVVKKAAQYLFNYLNPNKNLIKKNE